jgi:hypothetical protein
MKSIKPIMFCTLIVLSILSINSKQEFRIHITSPAFGKNDEHLTLIKNDDNSYAVEARIGYQYNRDKIIKDKDAIVFERNDIKIRFDNLNEFEKNAVSQFNFDNEKIIPKAEISFSDSKENKRKLIIPMPSFDLDYEKKLENLKIDYKFKGQNDLDVAITINDTDSITFTKTKFFGYALGYFLDKTGLIEFTTYSVKPEEIGFDFEKVMKTLKIVLCNDLDATNPDLYTVGDELKSEHIVKSEYQELPEDLKKYICHAKKHLRKSRH